MSPDFIHEVLEGRSIRTLSRIQNWMGFGAWSLVTWPYLRRVHGMEHLAPDRRYLIVANHVSLLDTIFLGGLCWRRRAVPILVLGDKAVWENSRVKRLLSGPIGFLLERGKLNPARIRELRAFGRASRHFQLVVFPEGTRGDGIQVGPCQPGLYYIAQEAQAPILPLFLENMQRVSTKKGRFHPIGGLRRVEVHFGEPIEPGAYLPLAREAFTALIQQRIAALRPSRPEAHWNPALPPA